MQRFLAEHLARNFYFITGLTIYQGIATTKHGEPLRKDDIHFFTNLFFAQSDSSGELVSVRKGRPPKKAKIRLQQRIELTVVAFKLKHNGLPPTMAQIAKLLRISLPALKMRIKREGLQWKELREVT
jgi:hypothetical protein